MNTNTLEQAVGLKHQGLCKDYINPLLHHQEGWWNNLHNIGKGPVLCLDDLHRVFEFLIEKKTLLHQFPTPTCRYKERNKVWAVMLYDYQTESEHKYFNRTKNHAEDWTAILIWLLENNHVASEQVNEVLK